MKKLFVLMLLFVNVQLSFVDKSCEFHFGTNVQAQHMYKEYGDNCYINGQYWDVGPFAECDSIDKDMYQCSFCKQWFKEYEEMAQHTTTCNEKHETDYACGYCNSTFYSEDDRNEHEETCSRNPNRKQYECARCGKAFASEKEFNNHMPCDPKVFYVCEKCHVPFDDKYLYLHHKCKNW